VIELLLAEGAEVRYHDPYVPAFRVGGDVFQREKTKLTSVPLTQKVLRESDAVVIVTAHRSVNYKLVAAHAQLIIDSANAMAGLDRAERVVRLGAPAATRNGKTRPSGR
jgi:UDP-N-acetyl-D-glucosamine dehydrogenase